MIPTSSLVMIVINLILGFAIPICLAWWIVKKHNARLSTVLIGAATFIVFALVLESIVHQIVLKGPHGAAIQNNTLYFAIYGGLMAGLFEETGRFLSMKYLPEKGAYDRQAGPCLRYRPRRR
jgi:Predicted membrane protein